MAFATSARRIAASRVLATSVAIRPFHSALTLRVSDKFTQASAAVQNLPSVDNQAKLKLYALYKQATVGANTTPKPGMLDVVGKYKWQAWSDLKDMSKEDAEKEYIKYCTELGAFAAPAAPTGPSETSLAGGLVQIKDDGKGVRIVTINRPEKRNSLTMEMYAGLMQAFDDAEKDASVRVLVLTGAGPFFSAGNDLSNFAVTSDFESVAERARVILHGYVQRFIRFPKPLVVGLNGPAVGIAVTTLPLADYVLASHKTTLHAPLVGLGQTPEGCSSYTFPMLMGHGKATELLTLGRKLTAEEGQSWGLVSSVVEESSFPAALAAKAAEFAVMPPNATKESKKILREPILAALEAANTRECDVIKKCWLGPEVAKAVAAFLSRKK